MKIIKIYHELRAKAKMKTFAKHDGYFHLRSVSQGASEDGWDIIKLLKKAGFRFDKERNSIPIFHNPWDIHFIRLGYEEVKLRVLRRDGELFLKIAGTTIGPDGYSDFEIKAPIPKNAKADICQVCYDFDSTVTLYGRINAFTRVMSSINMQ